MDASKIAVDYLSFILIINDDLFSVPSIHVLYLYYFHTIPFYYTFTARICSYQTELFVSIIWRHLFKQTRKFFKVFLTKDTVHTLERLPRLKGCIKDHKLLQRSITWGTLDFQVVCLTCVLRKIYFRYFIHGKQIVNWNTSLKNFSYNECYL